MSGMGKGGNLAVPLHSITISLKISHLVSFCSPSFIDMTAVSYLN